MSDAPVRLIGVCCEQSIMDASPHLLENPGDILLEALLVTDLVDQCLCGNNDYTPSGQAQAVNFLWLCQFEDSARGARNT